MSVIPRQFVGFRFKNPVCDCTDDHVRRTIPSRCRGGKQEHDNHSNHNKQGLLLHWKFLLLSRCQFD